MLSGLRILVVEDEPLVAEHIADVLTEAEGSVIGPFSRQGEARQLVRNGTKVDVALLDVNVGDGPATPLLEALAARGIPTLMYTGGELPASVRKRHPDLTVLSKPVTSARLLSELRRASRKVLKAV
jgi:DNA-binding NtrC family response regulator